MSLLSITITLFFIMNSVGHISSFLGLVDHLDEHRRSKIILREMLIALAIMIVCHYVGDILLDSLDVTPITIQVAGGVILFLIALRMIFPQPSTPLTIQKEEEPFIVPLAVPMIVGPSALATIMLYSHDESGQSNVLEAILIAWAFTSLVLFFAHRLKQILTSKGLAAIERLMGLILTLIAVEMFLKGMRLFILNLHMSV